MVQCINIHYNYTCFMLDCQIAQQEHQKLIDELQHNQQNVKHLESNIKTLYQTAEIWKKGNRDTINSAI